MIWQQLTIAAARVVFNAVLSPAALFWQETKARRDIWHRSDWNDEDLCF